MELHGKLVLFQLGRGEHGKWRVPRPERPCRSHAQEQESELAKGSQRLPRDVHGHSLHRELPRVGDDLRVHVEASARLHLDIRETV